MAGKTVWILTFEVNDHNQQGRYFQAAFAGKPGVKQLAEVLYGATGMPSDIMAGIAFLEHLRAGGGRQNTEDTWYILEECPLHAGS